MNASSAGNSGQFKKGEDSRRNANGALGKEASAFSMKFRNALSKKMTPDAITDILIEEVKKKKPWAIQEFLDRLMGKSTQPIEHKGEMSFTISDKFLPKGSGAKENGSKPK